MATEFLDLIENLHFEYPQFITNLLKIGKTHQNRELMAFKLGDLDSNSRKSQVLLTSLHHSREPLSLTMNLQIFISKLHELIHRTKRPDFFDTSELLFIPIVNLDSYTLINQHYGKKDWEKFKRIRKN